jgi:hypothetical protein
MTDKKRPIALIVAVILVWIEAAASFVYAALQAINLISSPNVKDVGGAVSVVIFFVLVAAWLAFSATKLIAGRRWARNAILFWQFMQIAVSSAAFDAHFGNLPVGLAGMVPAVLIVGLLFTPKVIKITTDEVEPSSPPEK